MKTKKNISVMNAVLRITFGLTAVAWATSRLTKRQSNLTSLFVAMIGAMKVGEGVHRYCPVTEMVKPSKGDEENEESSSEHQNVEQAYAYEGASKA